MSDKYKKVENFYGSLSNIYDDIYYDTDKLFTSKAYMAEIFRYRLIIKRLNKLNISGKILDIGCGEGTPLVEICKSTKLTPYAFDVTDEMVSKAKNRLKENGFKNNNVIKANIADLKSFDDRFDDNFFNASLCLGVMPHVPNVLEALKNIRKKMTEGSVSFVSFRNLLFSMFTLNRYSKNFFLENLMNHLETNETKKVEEDLNQRFAVNLPPIRKVNEAGGTGYDTIPAKFHNPLTIKDIVKKAGFNKCTTFFYHFHPVPPMYENKLIDKKLFRELAINMEKNPTDWRGYFMCSAFLLELSI